MLPIEYKQQLTESIPVVAAMGVDIVDVGNSYVIIKAPLDVNINYQGTAFGGSLNTVAILSCYLMVHHLLRINQVPFSTLVIQDSSIQYLRPVTGDFFARAEISDEAVSRMFLKVLWSKRTSRIQLTSDIYQAGEASPCVRFQGRFVATLEARDKLL